jgi:DNA-binding PadR family transcriptional regulator
MQASWPSENIILGLLCERPMHGYELSRLVQEDEALRAIWRIERSEIYFLLRKLLKGGLIMESAAEQGGGPVRVIYAPTAAGRAEYGLWLRTPELRPRNLRSALLARVYLALRHDPQVAVELIDAQKQNLAEWLEHVRQEPPENEVVALVHRLRAAQVAATLEALDEMRNLALARWQPLGNGLQGSPQSNRQASD